MRLLIIRHGDPDYEHDSLTEAGRREAELLAERIAKLDIKDIYVSSYGRAMETAGYSLKKMGREATKVCDWMQEFHGRCRRPNDPEKEHICWDWLPKDWTCEPDYYDKDRWAMPKVLKESNARAEYDRVVCEFDRLLAEHGYEREGNIYLAKKPNNDTIAFFCHFGLESVMLSHLLGISPMILWHATAAPTTSVTTVYTEERTEGIASFRIQSYGDISHLYAAGVEPSFSARFCECYSNENERHY